MASKKRRKARHSKPNRSQQQAAPPRDERDLGVASLVLAFVAMALYANAIPNDYALDDTIVITQNEFTQAGVAGIGSILAHDTMRGFSAEFVDKVGGGRYRPLSLVTFAVEQQIVGGNPHVSHAINAVLFALCVVVLYHLFADLLVAAPARPWPLSTAFLAALIFAVHPIHTEVVSNIKGRDELLSLTGALGCTWMGIRAAPTSGLRPLLASAAIFFLALLSKENAITFLGVVPLTVWFFRPNELGRLRRWMPLLVATALVFVAVRQSIVLANVASDDLLNDPFLGASLTDQYATIFYTLLLYLKLLAIPHPLTFDYYPYHVPILGWSDWHPWLGLIAYLALAGVAAIGFRRRSVIAYGCAFYLVTLSITSNLLVPVGTFMAERFLFAPSVGACLIGGWVLAEGSRRFLRDSRSHAVVVAVVAGVVVVSFGGLTLARNPVWKDNLTLTTTDVQTSTGSALANATAAQNLLIAARDLEDPVARADFERRARGHLERAVEIHPRYKWATRALANFHAERGEVDRAIDYFQILYELDPNAAYKVGTYMLEHRRDRSREAVRYLEVAVTNDPTRIEAIGNLAGAYYFAGDSRRAAETFEQALSLRPNDAELNLNLAKLYHALGDDRFEAARARAEALGAIFEPLDETEGRTEP